jgi:GNAT superfamily N-acetyltransferase
MPVIVEPYGVRPCSQARQGDLDRIFFTSSATQQFSGPAERAAFRERWLGRYLRVDPGHAFVAIDGGDRIVGYVIGCIDDIARLARFADLASARQFSGASARYPAHLHINVDEGARSLGIGARLIEAFAAHCVAHGAPGMHVVTGASSRNVRFYARCGFAEVARIGSGGGDKVFLARDFRDGQCAVNTA